jgi:hypothetical protein
MVGLDHASRVALLGHCVSFGIWSAGMRHDLAQYHATPRVRRMIKEAALPCVETGNLGPRPIEMAVGIFYRDAARAMTEHLIGRGYRCIGFVSRAASGIRRRAMASSLIRIAC